MHSKTAVKIWKEGIETKLNCLQPSQNNLQFLLETLEQNLSIETHYIHISQHIISKTF